jgi:hypothetical protein
MNYHRATVDVAGGAGTGGDEVNEKPAILTDTVVFLCISVATLAFLLGLFAGISLEQAAAISRQQQRIEQLEAVK